MHLFSQRERLERLYNLLGMSTHNTRHLLSTLNPWDGCIYSPKAKLVVATILHILVHQTPYCSSDWSVAVLKGCQLSDCTEHVQWHTRHAMSSPCQLTVGSSAFDHGVYCVSVAHQTCPMHTVAEVQKHALCMPRLVGHSIAHHIDLVCPLIKLWKHLLCMPFLVTSPVSHWTGLVLPEKARFF